MKRLKALWVVVCLLALVPVPAEAQSSTTGAVIGTVRDPSDAVIAGVEVKLESRTIRLTQMQTTNATGQYVFPSVPPGTYSITVTAKGFRTTTAPELKVEVAKSYTVDFKLELGDLAEVVQVEAQTAAELQTTDATVGNVLSGTLLPRMPVFTRRANELLLLQPAAAPDGSIAGSRSDQSTFALDGIDVTNQSIGGTGTYTPLPIDTVEEFRVGIANNNAAFGRGAGGQVSIISKSGTNAYHGALFWYHQNDALNAHTWTDKRLGKLPNGQDRVREPETKDNRFGFRFGGPVPFVGQDKTFFFLNYEGRRFPRSSPILRLVPSDSLRAGTLRFNDGTGVTRTYNLAGPTAALPTQCGAGNTTRCDPRGLGLSPVIAALWSRLPAGNDPSSGDGLNTIGFRSNVGNPLKNNNYVIRVDHNLTTSWRIDAQFRYFGETAGGSGLVSIIDGDVSSRENFPVRQNFARIGVRGQFSSSLSGEFAFGWVRNRTASDRFRPNESAGLLAITGTQTGLSSGQTHVALDLGALGGTQSLLSEPVDVGTQVARKQGNDNRNYQWNADMTWIRGKHTFQFGGHVRYLPTLHFRDDKVLGALGALVAQLDAELGTIRLPATVSPPTCSATVTTNCLTTGDVQQWRRLYASALGLIDNISVLAVRDAQFNPLPFGDVLVADTTLWAPEMYVQDVWRITPALTITLGLNYGWQTPPKEAQGRQTIMIDAGTGEPLTAKGYLRAREQAMLAGTIFNFNPLFAYVPIEQSNRSGVFDVDWNNWGPRGAVAWNPSFDNGFLGWVFGNRKTVLRGGFSLVYDRQNTVQSVIVPTLGIGFAQTLNISAPLCNATGAGGAGCASTSTNPALNGFRLGFDGQIPLPTVPAQTIPVSPFWGRTATGSVLFFPEILSFQVDPKIEVGQNYAIDLTWQRELPKDFILEFGYIGRYASKLPQSMNFGQVPYLGLDTASGQNFAQAFDAVATQLRGGTAGATVTVQPWFENSIPSAACRVTSTSPIIPCTQWIAQQATSSFVNGNLNSLFELIDNRRVANFLPPFNNWMARTMFMRSSTGNSNYNALFVTVNKRMSYGLHLIGNYTFSRSLDQLGAVQNAASVMPNNFDLDAEYGPSGFDFTHLLNVSYLYELPFGPGRRFSGPNSVINKFIGGWHVAGIFTAQSGQPLIVAQGTQVWGGSHFLGFTSGAVPTVDPLSFGNSSNFPITGSNNIGINSNRATGGSGFNLYENPEAVFNSFRRVLISQDGRSGRSNPLRGMPRWNMDVSIGKKTAVTENISVVFSFDFFNITNHVDFDNPSLDLTNPRAFGVITTQFTPPNRTVGSRWIQFGLRVEF